MKRDIELILSDEQSPLGFNPLSMMEKLELLAWAERSTEPFSDVVVRMVMENNWFAERLWKYSIIGEDALDILLEEATEEHNIAWS